MISEYFPSRFTAERVLRELEDKQGFTLLVLQLVALLSSSVSAEDVAIRQSAAVLFKNVVKKKWQPDDGDKENTAIFPNDREILKGHLVDLMCSTPSDVQKQLAEAVSIISRYDFPAKWDSLLDQLIHKLETKDLSVAKGVMLTANSIFKRFRYVFKSDELYSELSYCLKHFQEPLTAIFQQYGNLVVKHANDKNELHIVFETLRLIARIFFSLNWQDLPEYFEDHMDIWMNEFAKYMSYTNPLLVYESDKMEPGPIDKLQAAIVEALVLYVSKYEDEFSSHLPTFTQLIWQVLLKSSAYPKHDIIVTNGLKYLTSVCSKQMYSNLFSPEILLQIVEQVILPNITATDLDEELFEDNPMDYIQKDMEGSDQDTRKRCACDLTRGLLKFFAAPVSQLCLRYIETLLQQYTNSQCKSWRPKDTALNLVLAVTVMNTSAQYGASDLNPNINILDIFNSHILPEVNDVQVDRNPIVKADAIKLLCVFRSHLDKAMLISLIQQLGRYLQASSHTVVQTYAALAIERFLGVKDKDANTGRSVSRITRVDLGPLLPSLLTALFDVLTRDGVNENDYVMKCIMRVLLLADSDVAPVLETVVRHLTAILEHVSKNPANPHFNHYLFESLAILVRSSCATASSTNPDPAAACALLESALFPPFQLILSADVTEFIPYVFQIFAQLLFHRPRTPTLSPAYLALFPPLLSPILWERKGNVPALIVLFRAYIMRGVQDIIAGNHLTAVLGIFQKMLSSKVSSQLYSGRVTL